MSSLWKTPKCARMKLFIRFNAAPAINWGVKARRHFTHAKISSFFSKLLHWISVPRLERGERDRLVFGQKTTNEYQFSRVCVQCLLTYLSSWEKNAVIGKITWEKEQLTIKEMRKRETISAHQRCLKLAENVDKCVKNCHLQLVNISLSKRDVTTSFFCNFRLLLMSRFP